MADTALKIPRVWDEFETPGGVTMSHAAAFMLLTLHDTRKSYTAPDETALINLWRRYAASNLSDREWSRAAWIKNDAGLHAQRAVRELHQALNLVDYFDGRLRIPPFVLGGDLVSHLRDKFAAKMPGKAFANYCISTYERVTGKFAK